MKRTMVAGLLGVLVVSTAFAARGTPQAAPPRATDLLRAQRMADDVEDRLRLPPPTGPGGWRQGGGGWDTRPRAKKAGGSKAITDVRPPGRR